MTTKEFFKHIEEVNPILKNFALRLTQDEEKALDLYQETVCKALKNKDSFTEGTNFKAWITTIMRNTFINDYRKAKNNQSHLNDSTKDTNTTKSPTNSIYQSVPSKVVSTKHAKCSKNSTNQESHNSQTHHSTHTRPLSKGGFFIEG